MDEKGASVEATANVVVTKDGELRLDGEVLPREGITERLRARVAADPKLQAVIAADKKLEYGEVVGVIDLVKGAGVQTFALNIERTAPGQP